MEELWLRLKYVWKIDYMKCFYCNQEIPQDSKYCPDCGKPIKNITDLHSKVLQIYNYNIKGYNYYATIGCLPKYVYSLSNMNSKDWKKIIAYHQKFIDKNLEIILEEERTEQKQKKEQERYIRDTMQRMNITNQDVTNMFLLHPERVNDQHWIDWAIQKHKH